MFVADQLVEEEQSHRLLWGWSDVVFNWGE